MCGFAACTNHSTHNNDYYCNVGSATQWLQQRLDYDLRFIHNAPSMHDLLGKVSHHHVTARKPQQELMRIVRRHATDPTVCRLVFDLDGLSGDEALHKLENFVEVGD